MIYYVDVPSRKTWVDTNLEIQPGDHVSFHADGIWVDAYIPCTADGYPARLFYSINLPPRIPDEGRYFRLMGRLAPDYCLLTSDDQEQTFIIGSTSQRTFHGSGRLFVFCNDRKGYYWNNWGALRLTIEISRFSSHQ